MKNFKSRRSSPRPRSRGKSPQQKKRGQPLICVVRGGGIDIDIKLGPDNDFDDLLNTAGDAIFEALRGVVGSIDGPKSKWGAMRTPVDTEIKAETIDSIFNRAGMAGDDVSPEILQFIKDLDDDQLVKVGHAMAREHQRRAVADSTVS